MASTLLDNPIAYAQFKLRGGWKNTLSVTAVYAVLLVAVVILTVRLNEPRDTTSVLNGWVTGLLVIEAGLLLLYGASRVSAAIRRDVTQQMLESHQLMPVGGFTAVVGYLIGAGSQSLVMMLATMVVGLFVARGAGIDPLHFAGANVALLLFAAFVWIVSAFSAFLMKGGLGLFVSLIVGAMMFGENLISLLPGVRVLMSPLFIGTLFTPRTSMEFIPWAYGVSVVAQAFVGFVCFIGAARKYRRGEDSALGPMLGLALVAGWVAISSVGIVYNGEFGTPGFHRGTDIHVQVVAAIVSAMLLSVVPLGSSAWAAAEYRRHQLEDDPQPRRRPMPLVLVALLATLLLLPLAWARPDLSEESSQRLSSWYQNTFPLDATLQPVLATALVVGAFMIGMAYLLRWNYLAGPRAMAVGIVWIALTWLGPLMADFMILEAIQGDNGVRKHPIAAISPIGALAQIWDAETIHDYRLGLVVQVVLNALPVLAYRWATRRGAEGLPPTVAA
ncbi:MAG TPA: hypothetical protein VGN72_05695 [Tepidisphaeraceae bacterium]|jgi:hypothetical protein|nr:hypothetical protein [Tepidisphaeraceae bacterium]